MPAPASPTWAASLLVTVHTAVRDAIDGGSSAGFIRIRSSSDVLLAQVPLTDPCGSVNGTTGQLTVTPSARDESADASGTAAYGEICTSAGTVLLALPAQAGSSPVSGKIVLTSLTITAGAPVEVLSCTIG